jgi:hypothetical protein
MGIRPLVAESVSDDVVDPYGWSSVSQAGDEFGALNAEQPCGEILARTKRFGVGLRL